MFVLSRLNITTDAEFKQFLGQDIFPDATKAQIDRIAAAYPNDPATGSPFGTGTRNQLSPQYKRLAAFEGDLVSAPNYLIPEERIIQSPVRYSNPLDASSCNTDPPIKIPGLSVSYTCHRSN